MLFQRGERPFTCSMSNSYKTKLNNKCYFSFSHNYEWLFQTQHAVYQFFNNEIQITQEYTWSRKWQSCKEHSLISKELIVYLFDVWCLFNKQTILPANCCSCILSIHWSLSNDTADHFRPPRSAQTASSKSISTSVTIHVPSAHIRITSGGTQGLTQNTCEAWSDTVDILPHSTPEDLLFDGRSLCPRAPGGRRISWTASHLP